eukprot:GFUD01048092.1.p1 GENE.GFUD01048092.1~~GFUD01048092.1.p1  ORF type:complete len:182 (-),score=46.97 GFUD01048092.1:138-662(-)
MFLLYKDRTFPRTDKWIFAEDVAGDILRLAKDYNDARPEEGRGRWEKEESWKDYPDYWLKVTPGNHEEENEKCGNDKNLDKEGITGKDFDKAQSPVTSGTAENCNCLVMILTITGPAVLITAIIVSCVFVFHIRQTGANSGAQRQTNTENSMPMQIKRKEDCTYETDDDYYSTT